MNRMVIVGKGASCRFELGAWLLKIDSPPVFSLVVLVVYCQITFGPVYPWTRRTRKRLGMKRSLPLVLFQCVIVFESIFHV